MFLTVDGGGAGLRFAITNTGPAASSASTGGGLLPLNTWSHVAITLSGTTGTLYLNGTAVATNPNMTLQPVRPRRNTTQNWIGRSQFPDPFLNSTVDDFQIYDHALSGRRHRRARQRPARRRQRRVLQVRRDRRPHRTRLLRQQPQRDDRQPGTAATAQHAAVATPTRRSGHHDPRRLDQRAGHEHGRLHGRPEDGHRLRRQARGGHGHRGRQAGHPGAGSRRRHPRARPTSRSPPPATSRSATRSGWTSAREDRDRHGHGGRHLGCERHGPRPGRPAEVRPLVQPALQ